MKPAILLSSLATLAGVLLLILGRPGAGEGPRHSPPLPAASDGAVTYVYACTLVRVIDGDTLVLDIDLGFHLTLRDQHIRLLGIDAPELRGPEASAGAESKAALEALLADKALTIQTVKVGRPQDGFGRWLGVLFADGADVNAALLRQRVARIY